MKKVMNKIFKYLKNPKKIALYVLNLEISRILSDKIYLKIMYRLLCNKKLDLKNPKTFNEKIQWLKLNDRKKEYTKMVDKYEVREYIKSQIGEEYLIPIYGVWNNFDEINFDELQNQFVLKCTHDSGGVFICKDKKDFDIEKVKKKVEKCLQKNFYYLGREWPYKNIKPRIIIEKYMVDESKNELKDYKIFNFNGESKIIQVDFGRFTNHKRNIYDTRWNYLRDVSIEYPTDFNIKINKPKKLDQMLELARKLSKGIPFIRTDFYIINDNIYFGELTFYHGSGFEKVMPSQFDKTLGEWIKINQNNE